MRDENGFSKKVAELGFSLTRRKVNTLQINLGKLCNQSCNHCHVGAGPLKTRENMNQETIERVWQLVDAAPHLKTLDLTGGAPELNPNFRWLVRKARAKNLRVIDRCNLTVLLEPGQADLADFLAGEGVDIMASLPCYSQERVDKQRGRGVFEKSIEAIRQLNVLGYGRLGSTRILDLVYNPSGAFLPLPQDELEKSYKAKLNQDFGISFNSLLTITNMPIKRFKAELKQQGQLESYQKLLEDSFNSSTLSSLMCLSTLSVSWEGGSMTVILIKC